jgi:hypothetical protein
MDTTYLKMTARMLSSFDLLLGYIVLEPPSWIKQCRLLLSLSLYVLQYLVLYVYIWDLEDKK